ncbi:MAG: hypothetical protein AABM67_13105 [Acidobacteriota bacterium]
MTFDKKRNCIAAATFLVCVSLFLGCGSKKITNEQIDTDIGNQALKVTEGSPSVWTFNADTDRCFAIAESKYSDGKAEITARVASSQFDGQEDARIEDVKSIKTLLGQIVLNYKSEGGKWVLEKAESKSLNAKAISPTDWKNTFVPIQLSLCDSYDHKKK